MARRDIDNLQCIILAAGGSSRLGTPKQLVRHRGRPLLQHAAAAAAAATSRPPVVVLGCEALRLRACLRRAGCRCVVVANTAWRGGLGSSLRAGLDAVDPHPSAVMFVLADQPLIDDSALRRLIGAWSRRPGRAAATRYAGRVGVPAIVPRRLWPALRTLAGDAGAGALLNALPQLTVVEIPEAEVDIDVPADIERLRRRGGV